MPEAVIVATARTPIGRANKGSLKDIRADELGAFIVKSLMEKVPQVDPSTVDDHYLGTGYPMGEQGYNVARIVGLLAGLPFDVPGATVNRFCSSSLQTIRMAFHAIKAGEGDTYIASGLECVSRVGRQGSQEDLNPKLMPGGITWAYIPMGLTAENVAERFNVTREDMDEFAVKSQNRAVAAQEAGFFDRELTPVTLEDGTVVNKDDGPRPGTTYEVLSQLKPAFKEDGRVTAGNSCPLNDGAAAVLVMSEEKANALGLEPLARIVASAVSALDPEIMGVGPIEAIRKVLDRTKMSIEDIDVVELNEAFAAQVLPVCRETGIDVDEQLNPHGGAIALGHPFGMTGARIMCTLINDLQTLDKRFGLETMCVGGGQGMAMIVERMA
ncbi:MAG: acetyl-CoA C-acyltransferase [Chloroflexota bacterium]|nr:acetyl-CoA C-acyltransferase [Chloroflexota bacterium]